MGICSISTNSNEIVCKKEKRKNSNWLKICYHAGMTLIELFAIYRVELRDMYGISHKMESRKLKIDVVGIHGVWIEKQAKNRNWKIKLVKGNRKQEIESVCIELRKKFRFELIAIKCSGWNEV